MDTNNNNQNYDASMNNGMANSVYPQQMPAYPGMEAYPTQMPAYPENYVEPTQMDMPGMDTPVQETTMPGMDMPAPEMVSPEVETVAPQPEVAPTLNSEDVTVISTNRGKKGGGAVVIVIVLALIFFVLNIDKAEDIYNKYIKDYILFDKSGAKVDNLNGGFIQVDDPNSFDTLDGVKFYNFNTLEKNKLALNYKSDTDQKDASNLDIYIEIYDVNKDLIYKELFDPKKEVKKNTVREYNIELSSDIYEKIKYAKIKKYTNEEKTKTSKLTCTLIEETDKYNINYKNVYYFTNDGLTTYDVSEEIVPKEGQEESSEVKEYKTNMEKAKEELVEVDPTYLNGKLEYTVDTSKNFKNYKLVEDLHTTTKMVRVREEKKKWKCE